MRHGHNGICGPGLANDGGWNIETGQNKDPKKQPKLGGHRVPTFDELKARFPHYLEFGTYPEAVKDWAQELCMGPQSDATFCVEASSYGLLEPDNPGVHKALGLLVLAGIVGLVAAECFASTLCVRVVAGTADAISPEGAAFAGGGAAGAAKALDEVVDLASAARTCVNSFTPETLVLMADGTHKAIKDIRVGDKVIATNPETEETGPRTVEATIIGHGLKKLVDLTIDTDGPAGGQTAFVVATAGHPFWVDGQQRWVRAADLHAGEDLLTQEGEPVRILTVRTYDQFNTVHNLSIESIHSYYVIAGDTAVLVHNTGPCWSIGSRMRAAGPGDEFGLPDQGRIRYVPPRGYNPVDPLPRGAQGGYLDRFGNEWVAGPSRTSGQPFEWEVQLSRRGKSQLGWLSRDRNHVNVSPLGEVTHR